MIYCFTQTASAVRYLEAFEAQTAGMDEAEFAVRVRKEAERRGIKCDLTNGLVITKK